MLSRVADNLFWMSRYLERAEHVARVLEVNLNLNLERSPENIAARWGEVLAGVRHPIAGSDVTDVYTITKALSFDTNYHTSIISYIEAARENARQVREQISSEMWEQINGLYLALRGRSMQDIQYEPREFFRGVRDGSHLFQGITDSTMNHGAGWHFIQVGRYIERAEMTARFLDVKFTALHLEIHSAEEFQEWVGLLKCLTAFEAYCKVHTADVRPDRVAEFLLLNREFPRSISFCVRRVQDALTAIAEDAEISKSNKVNRLAGKLEATVDFSQIDEIMSGDLHSFLNNIQLQCKGIFEAIYQTYISYAIESALPS
ncbi:MAG: alpha-E domain-containing protein [Anaerolineae bacterium]|nr:alpha-E domain-containing protein [Anaerolineae bacterium]